MSQSDAPFPRMAPGPPTDLPPGPGDIVQEDSGIRIQGGQNFLLFCTGNTSTETIEDLLRQSQSTTKSYNCWSLVRSKSQQDFDQPTHVPIQDFQNEFVGASIDSLGSFAKDRIEGRYNDLDLSSITIGILDERSTDDNTMLIAAYDPEDEEEEEAASDQPSWKPVRVRFDMACYTAMSMEFSPFPFFEMQDGGESDNGVLRVTHNARSKPRSAEELQSLPPP